MGTVVQIYSKAGCSLCEEALEVMGQLQKRWGFSIEEIDILAEPELFARYRYDVPVIFIGGVLAFRHRVDVEAAERILRQHGTSVASTRHGNGPPSSGI